MDIRIDEDSGYVWSATGQPPPVGADAIVYATTIVATLPASSYLTVNYPFTFAGIKTINPSPGDTAGGVRFTIADAPNNQSGTTLNIRCTSAGDTGIGGQTVRINVIVVGW